MIAIPMKTSMEERAQNQRPTSADAARLLATIDADRKKIAELEACFRKATTQANEWEYLHGEACKVITAMSAKFNTLSARLKLAEDVVTAAREAKRAADKGEAHDAAVILDRAVSAYDKANGASR